MKSIHKCPFCESDDIVVEAYNYTTETVLYTIHCLGCGVALTRNTAEQAINAWNDKCEECDNDRK